MFNRFFSILCVVLFLAGAFTLFGVFSPSLQAQSSETPEEAQPGETTEEAQPGEEQNPLHPSQDPNYKYPELANKDFQLYLDLIDYMENNKDLTEFYKTNNVTEEYIQAVVFKISVNTIGKLADNMEEVESAYGKNILFNVNENELYKKYEDQIMESLVKLGKSGSALIDLSDESGTE
jgi:hypothetical protein